jgi:hypothetical protein
MKNIRLPLLVLVIRLSIFLGAVSLSNGARGRRGTNTITNNEHDPHVDSATGGKV